MARKEEKKYQATEIEAKWQKKWKESGIYQVDLEDESREKYYNLTMFPYPSGDKLHVGHWYNYGPADSWGRYMRMRGHNVLEPMGFDSFGLPAENYAIKTGTPPAESTTTNIGYMRKQLGAIGTMYDWDKEVVTSSPEYYQWTQWLFLELFKKGYAYKKLSAVNWCPNCHTVLANEQVENGHCERCKTEITKKNLNQWFFKITDYAEKLLDYQSLDWPEKTIAMQRNWIGKSKGAEIDFRLADGEEILTVYTTRPDTVFSVSYLVLSPEHPLVDELTLGTPYEDDVKEVRKNIDSLSLIERTSDSGKDKVGCFIGRFAINPVNGEKIPVYIGSFVLMYGTGVVMANAHDQRDFEFARKYDIDLKFVISEDGNEIDPKDFEGAYTADGVLFDSGDFSGMNNREALPKMVKWIEGNGWGRATVNYKLRDWLVSRQRYWGVPIPIVYDPEGKPHPIPDNLLPWNLPTDVDFEPDGEAPLARSDELFDRTERIFGEGWTPEVDTMDTFVCSSWYYLRYPDNMNVQKPFDQERVNKWAPVDMYIGGPEHACMHLLYARFINMFLHDQGYVDFKEPFKRLVHQGMITKDGAKMSKSKGNVVSPDDFVEKYGSDVFRMYLMFMGPYTEGGDWNDKGITGIARFVDRFWRLINKEGKPKDKEELKRETHKLIKKCKEEIEQFHFNTMIAAMMEFVNFAYKNGVDEETKEVLVRLLGPIAPHLAEECWERVGQDFSVVDAQWPQFDKELAEDDVVTLGVQVNGKLRGEVEIAADADQETAIAAAKENENVVKYLTEGKVVKEIYVPGRIIGFVVK